MGVCRECNVEVEGKFCGECGKPVDAAGTPERTTKVVQFCNACNVESSGGKFCGECGGALTEKEVEVSAEKGKGKSAGGLSIFEQNALKTQRETSAVAQVRDHKFGGSSPAKGAYQPGFGESQRRAAQEASRPQHGVSRWSTQTDKKPVYVGSFGDEQRKKAQENARASGFNKFGGQAPVAGGGGMDFVTANNVQKQKMMNEANRTGDGIVKSTEKKCEGAIDMQTANAIEKQKQASEASRAKDNIVMSTEKPSNDGVLSVADANAIAHQKETSNALKRQDNLVKKSEGTGEAPHVGGGGSSSSQSQEVYRCDGCDAERPPGKFCQECGSKLVVA